MNANTWVHPRVSSRSTAARRWHATDPQPACGGSLFYSQWGDCVWRRRWAPDVCWSHPDHGVRRWSTALRSFQHLPAGSWSLPLLSYEPNISVLDDRCVLCWEIYFPLYGVFTLAGRFDWYYSGCISMLLQCQYHQGCCSILINCCAGDFQDDLLTRWVEVEAVTFNWIFSY